MWESLVCESSRPPGGATQLGFMSREDSQEARAEWPNIQISNWVEKDYESEKKSKNLDKITLTNAQPWEAVSQDPSARQVLFKL